MKDEFKDLVKRMRDSQKRYFKTRDLNVLTEARRLESEVDRALSEYEQDEMGGSLFGRD